MVLPFVLLNTVKTYKVECEFVPQMTKQDEMSEITNLVYQCKKCDLHKTRNKPVSGEGSLNAKILFIGEARRS